MEAASLDHVTLQLSGVSFHHEGYDQHAQHGHQNERMEDQNHVIVITNWQVFYLGFQFDSHRIGISESFSRRSKPDVSQKESPFIDEVISNDLEGLQWLRKVKREVKSYDEVRGTRVEKVISVELLPFCQIFDDD